MRAERQGDRAEVALIVAPSPDRVAPPCPHFGDCGGCALQHWAPAPYLAWKAEQVRLALARERIETEILPTFAAPAHARRRLALHARAVGKGVALGFKARRSWRLVEIGVCPIAHPALEAAFPVLAALAKPFLEHPKSAPTLHTTWTETGLDVDVTGIERRSGGLSADALRARRPSAPRRGISRGSPWPARSSTRRASRWFRVGKVMVGLPPGGFLQAVPEAEAAMAAFAVQAIDGASRVADLFCGVGAFSFRLAEVASVHASDVSAASIKALVAASGTATGLKAITAEARDLSRRPMLAAEMKRMDAVLFDPPRAGAAEQAREIAASKAPIAIGVSCDAATFARDARILVDGGFRLGRVLPVDQFLWSPHVELVGVFTR